MTSSVAEVLGKRIRPDETRRRKKEQGDKPCSRNCVDPIFPKMNLILIGRGDAACARQGSSRDLDHQSTLRSA